MAKEATKIKASTQPFTMEKPRKIRRFILVTIFILFIVIMIVGFSQEKLPYDVDQFRYYLTWQKEVKRSSIEESDDLILIDIHLEYFHREDELKELLLEHLKKCDFGDKPVEVDVYMPFRTAIQENEPEQASTYKFMYENGDLIDKAS